MSGTLENNFYEKERKHTKPTKKTIIQNIKNYKVLETENVKSVSGITFAYYFKRGIMYLLPNLTLQDPTEYDFIKNEIVQYNTDSRDSGQMILAFFGHFEKGQNYLTYIKFCQNKSENIPPETLIETFLNDVIEEKTERLKNLLKEAGIFFGDTNGGFPKDSLKQTYFIKYIGEAS